MKVGVCSFILCLSFTDVVGKVQPPRNAAGMSLAEIEKSERKVNDAWKHQGILVHAMEKTVARDLVHTLKQGGEIEIDNDCGPMCSAYSWAKKGIPLVPAQLSGWRISFMFDRESAYFKEYVYGMLPTDGYTNGRQFCAMPQGMATTMNSISDKNLPVGFNRKRGCKIHDTKCRFVAAGGSVHAWRVAGEEDNQTRWYHETPNFTQKWYGLNSNYTKEQVWDGKSEQCKKPDLCSEKAARNWFMENVQIPLEHTKGGMFGNENVQHGVSTLSCKLDGRNPKHWEYLETAYINYLVYIHKYLHKQHHDAWNEVNAYVPPRESPEYKQAQELFAKSILGVYFTPPTHGKDSVEYHLAKELAIELNKKYPHAKINLYICPGRKNFSAFKSSKDYPVDELFSKRNGCTLAKGWLPKSKK